MERKHLLLPPLREASMMISTINELKTRLEFQEGGREVKTPLDIGPEPVFPYIPYLLAYPSGSSPALSSRRKTPG